MRFTLVFKDHIERRDHDETPEPALTLWTGGREHRFARYSAVHEFDGGEPVDVLYVEVGQDPDEWKDRLHRWLNPQAGDAGPQ